MNPPFVSLFALNFVNNPKLFADAKHTSELANIKQIPPPQQTDVDNNL